MNKKLVVLFSILTIAMLFWVFQEKFEKEPRQPIHIMESASWEEKSLDTLLYESDAIVVGYFESKLSSRWNTPNGKLPDNATFETIHENNLYIYTEYEFQVEEFLKGNQPENSIMIRTFGGQVGEDSMMFSSNTSYELGQPYLLFLSHDPRLAQDEDLGPYLVYNPATYSISNGIATSWIDEWNIDELEHHIRTSPFAKATINIPDTAEAEEIMQRVKASHDIEVNVKDSADYSKLSDIFVNDHRHLLNPDRLNFVRNVTNNPSLESAGYLDFKMSYIKNGFDPSGYEVPTESTWIRFISVVINDNTAAVVYDIGSRRKALALILIDDSWYIAGAKGVTIQNENFPFSVIAAAIPVTSTTQKIIQSIEFNYEDRILQFISIETDNKIATAYLHDGYKALILSLTLTDENWQITEIKGE